MEEKNIQTDKITNPSYANFYVFCSSTEKVSSLLEASLYKKSSQKKTIVYNEWQPGKTHFPKYHFIYVYKQILKQDSK